MVKLYWQTKPHITKGESMLKKFLRLLPVLILILSLTLPAYGQYDLDTKKTPTPEQPLSPLAAHALLNEDTPSIAWEVARLQFCQNDTTGEKRYEIRGIAMNFTSGSIDINVKNGSVGTTFTYNIPFNDQHTSNFDFVFVTDLVNTVESAQFFGNGVLFDTIPSSSFRYYIRCQISIALLLFNNSDTTRNPAKNK